MRIHIVTLVKMRSAKACRGWGSHEVAWGHMMLRSHESIRSHEVAWGHMMLRSHEMTIGHMRLVN